MRRLFTTRRSRCETISLRNASKVKNDTSKNMGGSPQKYHFTEEIRIKSRCAQIFPECTRSKFHENNNIFLIHAISVINDRHEPIFLDFYSQRV